MFGRFELGLMIKININVKDWKGNVEMSFLNETFSYLLNLSTVVELFIKLLFIIIEQN